MEYRANAQSITRDTVRRSDRVAEEIARYDEYLDAKPWKLGKRGGARLTKTKAKNDPEFEFSKSVKSGRMFRKWFQSWKSGGDDAHFDCYRNCGGHSRYDDDTRSFVCGVIETLLEKERVTIKSIAEMFWPGLKMKINGVNDDQCHVQS